MTENVLFKQFIEDRQNRPPGRTFTVRNCMLDSLFLYFLGTGDKGRKDLLIKCGLFLGGMVLAAVLIWGGYALSRPHDKHVHKIASKVPAIMTTIFPPKVLAIKL